MVGGFRAAIDKLSAQSTLVADGKPPVLPNNNDGDSHIETSTRNNKLDDLALTSITRHGSSSGDGRNNGINLQKEEVIDENVRFAKKTFVLLSFQEFSRLMITRNDFLNLAITSLSPLL